MTLYAIDVGATKMDFGVFDDEGRLLEKQTHKTPLDSWNHFSSLIKGQMSELEGKYGKAESIGIGVAATVDPKTEKASSASIKSIAGRNLSNELEGILSCPVFVGVDAECFTRVEVLKGKARGKNYVFGIILGTGVGGCFFIDGQAMKGRDGITGEWAHGNNLHEKLKAYGLKDHLCGCGQTSCLDSYGAGKGLERIHHQLHGGELSTKSILNNWRDHEPQACESVEIFITLLVDQLTVNVNILNPEIMPVAGGLAKATDLISEIDKRVRKNCIANYGEPLIVPGEFIIDGCLRGAALLNPAAI